MEFRGAIMSFGIRSTTKLFPKHGCLGKTAYHFNVLFSIVQEPFKMSFIFYYSVIILLRVACMWDKTLTRFCTIF